MPDYPSHAPLDTTPSMSKRNAADPLAAKANTTVAYTDGACKGNPGAGGWGAHLIFSDGRTQDLYGGEVATTNNRMELMGAIQALTHSPQEQNLEIWTDSSYVKNGITDWIEGWKKRGWKTASKKSVANQDLWQQLDELRQNRDVDWHWVKGHAGHAGNEKADELANLGVTTDSGHAAIVDHQESAKKKQPIVADDWLKYDPLGLDMIDEYDETVIENENESDLDNSTSVITPHMTTTENTQDDSQNSIDKSIETVKPDTMNLEIMNSKTMDADTMSADTAVSHHKSDDNNKINNSNNATPVTAKFDGDTSRANPNFQPLLPSPIHRHESNRQLIMDTETTGLDALKGDRVIEVGIVEMIGRKFTGEKLHVYINPQRGMDEEVIRIHGISEAFLTDKPTFDQVAHSLYEFMDGAEIIAHNASFDMNFLNMEFGKVGMTDFAQRVQVTDSLAMAKQQYPGQKNTLDALVRRLNVGKQDRTFHGALLDSEILAEVYLAMTGGQVSLAIEEDSHSDGGQTTHSNFADLASLLLSSSQNDTANLDWFTTLVKEYPELEHNLSQW